MWGRSSVGRALEWHSSAPFFCFQSSGVPLFYWDFQIFLDKLKRLIYNNFAANKAVKFRALDWLT